MIKKIMTGAYAAESISIFFDKWVPFYQNGFCVVLNADDGANWARESALRRISFDRTFFISRWLIWNEN